MADIDEYEYWKRILTPEQLKEWCIKNKWEEKKLMSEQEIIKLTKEEQSKIIKSHGLEIPKYEKERVDLILKIQNK